MALQVYQASGAPLGTAMPKATTTNVGRVIQILKAASTKKTTSVLVNYDTGVCAAENITMPQAASRIRSGWVWVDYGAWPFGTCTGAYQTGRTVRVQCSAGGLGGTSCQSVVVNAPTVLHQGFASFILQVAGRYVIPPPDAKFMQINVSEALYPFFAHLRDAYNFQLSDWIFGDQIRAQGYPYPFGLPTTATASATFKPMTAAPHASIGLAAFGQVNQMVYVYSAFGLRLGNGWYFNAQPGVDPTQYAAFILQTLGIPVPSIGSQAGTSTPSVSCTQTNKPTLAQGTTGAYVRLAQQRLNAWGEKLTVDGVFGPQTYNAVVALQKQHDHQYYGGKQVLVTGQIGPGTWNMLCSPPGTKGSSTSTSSPPSQGAAPPCQGVFAGVAKSTGLSCTEVEILALGAVATLVVVLARG